MNKGSFFNLFNGEIKKIFTNLMMFIMAAIFILTLTFLPHFFNPEKNTNTSPASLITQTNVITAYSSFDTLKEESDAEVGNLLTEINNLVTFSEDYKNDLINKKNDLVLLRKSFDSAANQGQYETCLANQNEMILTISGIESLYNSYISGFFGPKILVTKNLDEQIRNTLADFKILLDTQKEGSDELFYNNLNSSIEKFHYIKTLNESFDKIEKISFNKDNLIDIKNKYSIYNANYKQGLLDVINEIYLSSLVDETVKNSKEKINTLTNNATHYLATNLALYNVIENTVLVELTSSLSNEEINNYNGFNSFNSYKAKELVNKNLYLLENNLLPDEINQMFAFNTNSGSETNAFDYMYFAMEVTSLLIIAFTVIIGAGMIAKEHSEGTIKLLAIRPYSRSKIMLAKILATIFFAFIFVLIGVVVSLISGIIIYGISFPNMLVVLNASVAFSLPIWVVFLIYIVCLMLKICFYAMLAIMISTLFKSYVASVCISSGIYIINLIITFVLKGSAVLKYNLFANLDLFKYFGGSFITGNNTNVITSLFSSGIFVDTNILVPIVILFTTIFVFNLVTFSVFKNRDIT